VVAVSQPARRSRALLLWLHVLSSVGWMSQALALLVLLVIGAGAAETTTRLAAHAMAEQLDERLLVHMANTAAFTGLMLSALTRWGYLRYWWVLVKFAITLVQIYVGIFVLSPRLTASAEAAARGQVTDHGWWVAGPLLMASAIGFQAWLSVAKPWPRTPWTSVEATRGRSTTAPAWVFGCCVAVPLVETGVGTFVLGHPMPVVSLLIAIGYPIGRARGRGATARGSDRVSSIRDVDHRTSDTMIR
jgi:hypothetical protein